MRLVIQMKTPFQVQIYPPAHASSRPSCVTYSKGEISGRKLKSLLHIKEKPQLNLAQHSKTQLLERSCSPLKAHRARGNSICHCSKRAECGTRWQARREGRRWWMVGGPGLNQQLPVSWAGRCRGSPEPHSQENLQIFCNEVISWVNRRQSFPVRNKAKCGNCWGWIFPLTDFLGAKRGMGEERLQLKSWAEGWSSSFFFQVDTCRVLFPPWQCHHRGRSPDGGRDTSQSISHLKTWWCSQT